MNSLKQLLAYVAEKYCRSPELAIAMARSYSAEAAPLTVDRLYLKSLERTSANSLAIATSWSSCSTLRSTVRPGWPGSPASAAALFFSRLAFLPLARQKLQVCTSFVPSVNDGAAVALVSHEYQRPAASKPPQQSLQQTTSRRGTTPRRMQAGPWEDATTTRTYLAATGVARAVVTCVLWSVFATIRGVLAHVAASTLVSTWYAVTHFPPRGSSARRWPCVQMATIARRRFMSTHTHGLSSSSAASHASAPSSTLAPCPVE